MWVRHQLINYGIQFEMLLIALTRKALDAAFKKLHFTTGIICKKKVMYIGFYFLSNIFLTENYKDIYVGNCFLIFVIKYYVYYNFVIIIIS